MMRRTAIVTVIGLWVLAAGLMAAPSLSVNGLYSDNTGSHTAQIIDSTLQGGDTMTLWMKVRHQAGFSNISHLLVTIYDTNYAALGSPNSPEYHAEYKYSRSDATWYLRSGSQTWSLKTLYSTVIPATNTSTNEMEMNLVFTIGSTAVEESVSKAWKLNVSAVDNTGAVTNLASYWKLKQVEQQTYTGTGSYNLYAAPNPVNTGLGQTIKFSLSSPGFSAACTADLRIYTIYGELVKVLFEGRAFNAGSTVNEIWDGKNGAENQVASGIYTAIMDINYTDGEVKTKEKKTFIFAVYK